MSDRIHVNGIDGRTGQASMPSMTHDEFAKAVLGTHAPALVPIAENSSPTRRLLSGLRDLKASVVAEPASRDEIARFGWGVIFARDVDPAVRAALKPLCDRRRSEAGSRYVEFAGDRGYVAGESTERFLMRCGIQPGTADPTKLPRHLLLVGPPAEIPFRVQEQLSVVHAVGRLALDDVESYARYAKNVVDVEEGRSPRRSGAGFFAPDHDAMTKLSATHLVKPLIRAVEKRHPKARIQSTVGGGADKTRLAQLLTDPQGPGILFSASHGLCYPSGDSLQRDLQGAIVCPADSSIPPNEPEQFFAARDLGDDADLGGLVAFFFACFGVGSPEFDNFAVGSLAKQPERKRVAPESFSSELPKKMLSRERGALAVIGHVDRAVADSFTWKEHNHIDVYEMTLDHLLAGHTVGFAMRTFAGRYAALASDLLVMLEDMRFGVTYPNFEVAQRWVRNNDARDVVILGDPAVRAV